MGRQRGSQEILITSAVMEEAIGEQLKSQAAEEGIENGERGTVATPQQIVGYRRGTENIFIAMSSNMPRQVKREKRQASRKRRRGPR